MKLSPKKAQKLILKPERPELRPVLDYPLQDEKITSRHYSIRVTAADPADQVDVSIDQGPWLQCRKSHGHWWFDWTDFDAGEHEVIARARQGDGRWMVCVPTEFMVL